MLGPQQSGQILCKHEAFVKVLQVLLTSACPSSTGCERLSLPCWLQAVPDLTASLDAEASARMALQRLLADYYGVEVDEDWLQAQGIDVSLLRLAASVRNADEAASASEAAASATAGTSIGEDYHHVGEGAGSDVAGEGAGRRATEMAGDRGDGGLQEQQERTSAPAKSQRRGGVLGFLGM